MRGINPRRRPMNKPEEHGSFTGQQYFHTLPDDTDRQRYVLFSVKINIAFDNKSRKNFSSRIFSHIFVPKYKKISKCRIRHIQQSRSDLFVLPKLWGGEFSVSGKLWKHSEQPECRQGKTPQPEKHEIARKYRKVFSGEYFRAKTSGTLHKTFFVSHLGRIC